MMLLERLLDIDLLGRTRMQRIKVQGDRQMVGSLFRCSSVFRWLLLS